MRKVAAISLCAFVLSGLTLAQEAADKASAPKPGPAALEGVSARALKLHRSAIVVDTHIDTTMNMMKSGWNFGERHCAPARTRRTPECNHVDLPRMKEGGLNAPFFSIYIDGKITGGPAVKAALERIATVRRLPEMYPEMVLARTAADIRAARKQGKIAVLMGMEGGHMIADSLPVLRSYADLGVRYLTLTHGEHTNWADSSSRPAKHNGLTDFGKDVVRELNRLGVMVDISHVSDKTFWDALEVSRAPMIASHSSARALCAHSRNMTDEMIKALAAKGGVVQVNYLDLFISEELRVATEKLRPQAEAFRKELEQKYPNPDDEAKMLEEYRAWRRAQNLPGVPWETIIQHIDHIAKLVGPQHVGLGSDFDGATMPDGMEDVTRLPKITDALLKRGYTEQQVRGILGENLLRVMEQVERVAKTSDAAGKR